MWRRRGVRTQAMVWHGASELWSDLETRVREYTVLT